MFNFNLFGPNPPPGMNLFGAPPMMNNLPEPGMPLSGGGGDSILSGGLGGDSPDVLRPPGAAPPPAGPPVPIPQPSLKPIPPSAASQLPPPLVGPGSDKPVSATTPAPYLPPATQGGVGPDVPPAATGPATTGATPAPAAGGETNPDGSPKKSGFQDFLEKAGQMDFGAGQQQPGLKPASIGSAGAPHLPQGAAQLFAQIMEGRQKMMPKIGKVPEIPGVLARLGIGR